jgi:hypothetical protein
LHEGSFSTYNVDLTASVISAEETIRSDALLKIWIEKETAKFSRDLEQKRTTTTTATATTTTTKKEKRGTLQKTKKNTNIKKEKPKQTKKNRRIEPDSDYEDSCDESEQDISKESIEEESSEDSNYDEMEIEKHHHSKKRTLSTVQDKSDCASNFQEKVVDILYDAVHHDSHAITAASPKNVARPSPTQFLLASQSTMNSNEQSGSNFCGQCGFKFSGDRDDKFCPQCGCARLFL